MEQALRTELLADAAIFAAVADRVSWSMRVQGEPLDAIVLYRIGGRRDVTFDGPSGFAESRVQADCLSHSFDRAKALADRVIARLHGRAFTHGTDEVQGVFVEREASDADATGAKTVFRTLLDLRVLHSTTA